MTRQFYILKELLLALTSLWSLWIVWGGIEAGNISVVNLLPAFLLLTGIWPRVGLALFLIAILPLGGGYPGTAATSFFLRSLGALTAGLWFRRLLHARNSSTPFPSIHLRHPLCITMVAFGITAMGSLLAIPLDEWGVRFIQLSDNKPFAITGVKETWVLYSFMKCMVLLTSLSLMIFLAEGIQRCALPPSGFLLLCGVGSYAVTISLGLLDYFGIFSLSWLRDIATGVKPDGTPLRLQSLFGHPAWCAMYISALAPTVVVLFDLKMKPWIRNSLVVALLVMGEYVLILTFARGGWVSYPFTLLAIWGCIYTMGSPNAGVARRQTRSALWRKIIISLPLTILISVGIMLISEHGDYGRYADRLKAVANATDRTVYIDPALKLAEEHPIMGGGVGSFAYRYVNDFVIPTGKYFTPSGGPLNRTFNNAHSLWLGLLVGQGVLGVLALLGILLATGWATRGVISEVEKGGVIPRSGLIEPLAWVALLCSVISLGVYGIFDDTFYPSSNVIILFILAGVALGASQRPKLMSLANVRRLLWVVFFCLMAQGTFEFIIPGKGRHLTVDPGPDGCYRGTQEVSESRFRIWCSEQAQIEVPLRTVGGQTYASLEVAIPPIDEGATEITVSLATASPTSPVLHIPLVTQADPIWLVLPLGAEFGSLSSVSLKIQLNRYLVPLRNPKIESLDRRRLAFAMPSKPTPFSENADNEARCIEVPANEPGWQDYWCAGGGFIPIPVSTEGPLDVSVRLNHSPTLAGGAVHLAYSGREALESAIVTLTDPDRVVIARGFDPQAPRGLRIASTRPAREVDVSGDRGFVVGFRRVGP